MSVRLQLCLEERLTDRVVVAVFLEPESSEHALDGVAVELLDRRRESLSPRVLLPISGHLTQAITVRVELRSVSALPVGALVEASAWWAGDQVRVWCPTEASTQLEAHVRGRHSIPFPKVEGEFSSLGRAEAIALADRFPWTASAGGREPMAEVADEISAELGLEGEDANWLRDLLHDDG